MTHYSIEPKDQTFAKGYRFLSFAEHFNIILSKSLSGNYSWKLLDHAKQSTTDEIKTASQRVIQKTAEAAGDLIGNKIANRNKENLPRIIQRLSNKQKKNQ